MTLSNVTPKLVAFRQSRSADPTELLEALFSTQTSAAVMHSLILIR